MKRILALVLALLSCVGLLSGCGGDTAGDPADAQTGDGTRPSIIRFSADSTPKIDPAVITDLVGRYVLKICMIISPIQMKRRTWPPIGRPARMDWSIPSI